jgi:hypothetical protein
MRELLEGFGETSFPITLVLQIIHAICGILEM